MSKFILLPGGDMVLKSAIKAVRVLGVEERFPTKPNVQVDYVVGDRGAAIIILCENNQGCSDLASMIRKELEDEA